MDIVTLGTAAASAAAKKAGETFGERLLSAAGAARRAFVDRAVVSLRLGFEEYLKSSYVRCRYFKTVLNPYEPADLEETYVGLELNDPSTGMVIKDSDLFKNFKNGEYIVVTGLAGSGKSMLMRYLTISSFDSLESGTPLYVELRKINDYESKDLIEFILKECSQKVRGVTKPQFELALRSQLFNLVLAGFDELEYEHRDQLSQQIVDLERDYPGIRVIVSSRPDNDRFRSWSSYKVYKVEEFSKDQARSLIRKTRYNEGVKERFLQALESRLFKSHQTFLASPLLTTIMLLTFEEYAEIPTKMHAFYARAFDTLFQKHDADKDQYVRKLKTILPKEDFKLLLSTFCAMSYLEQKFSFSRDAARRTAKAAITYSKQISESISEVLEDDFVCDLTDAVCMLQPDGLDLVFVHRSFQEYFSAVFIEKSHGTRVYSLLNKFSHRFSDSVVGMSLDMAREKVEAEWVIPNIDYYVQKLSRKNGRRDAGSILSSMLTNAQIHTNGNQVHFSFYDLDAKELGPIETICTIYPNQLGSTILIECLKDLSIEEVQSKILNPNYSKRPGYSNWASLFDNKKDAPTITIDISKKDNWWLNALGLNGCLDVLIEKLQSLKKEIKQREEARQEIMEYFI
ncbi:NACHT domain-containing protein [Sphingomonas nostoxanthinifaciens]|uniref:NACHT domain-containing protein n=1 Tax=Sphingomonas nostoxanthinifaciens TaxID=2872652 RepID=UPI001CC1F080|nr:NACHT domain-containing protein [Sphingomonas nostoxanthinifaciens]UAK24671.1 NACHT domain-containing protein [Sphingomonas nostoxanthinifaciens]